MQVTRYQMHNVLECYSKKISRARGNESAAGYAKKSGDEITLSSHISRMAAMDKISRQVLDKVMDVVALSSAGDSSRYSMRASDAVVGGVGTPAPIEAGSGGRDSIDRNRAGHLAMGELGE